MASTRYPINKEFFPYNRFTPPLGRGSIRIAQRVMRPPRSLFREAGISVEKHRIPAHEGGEIEVLVISPDSAGSLAPCLVDFHGGGFVFPASASHYRMAASYARLAGCKVVFPLYRLAPDYPFPFPQEDCFAALQWAYGNAQALGIDPGRIGVCGDSAGGALAVISCVLARDRGSAVRPLFQVLIYPWLDARRDSGSNRRFTDTPMWNSRLSGSVSSMTDPHPERIPLMMRSPAEAGNFEGLPPAYIEVAEFDCLRDDGIRFAETLRSLGIPADLRETKGTMHGFDTKFGAPTTQRMVAERADYMSRIFGKDR